MNYAKIAAPLSQLTGKDVTFSWGPEHQNSFQVLKNKLSSEPVVHIYNPAAELTEIHTAASSIALSGTLL